MAHIRQKNSNDITYTVVITTNWQQPLSEHPSVIEHPERFEVSDEEIPEDVQYLNYSSSI